MFKDLTAVQKAVLGGLVGMIVVSAGLAAWRRSRPLPPPREAYPAESPASPLVVSVAGAVLRPGVYNLPAGARVQQAVEAAGGLTPEGDPTSINLARRLRDGDRVLVKARPPAATPSRSSRSPSGTVANSPPTQPKSPRTARAEPPHSAGATVSPPAPAPVSLSRASPEELAAVPGVTLPLARKIVDYRTRYGGFRRVEELLLMPGVTPAKLEQIRPYVVP